MQKTPAVLFICRSLFVFRFYIPQSLLPHFFREILFHIIQFLRKIHINLLQIYRPVGYNGSWFVTDAEKQLAFARIKFKFKGFWRNFILIGNMFPIIAVVTPMFVIFRNMGLINTYAGLIIPSVIITLPMTIWTLEAFIKTLPYDLEEAAMVDGCNRLQSVIKIILPLTTPGIFTTAIIAFITAWNEFMFSLILVTRDEMRTVPVAISMFPGQYTVPWGDMAAASIVATVPIVIVVLIFQKKIVSGLTSGAVKG